MRDRTLSSIIHNRIKQIHTKNLRPTNIILASVFLNIFQHKRKFPLAAECAIFSLAEVPLLDLQQRLKVVYYEEGGYTVFTERAHLDRGTCCGSGCRHCPFKPQYRRGTTDISEEIASMVGEAVLK